MVAGRGRRWISRSGIAFGGFLAETRSGFRCGSLLLGDLAIYPHQREGSASGAEPLAVAPGNHRRAKRLRIKAKASIVEDEFALSLWSAHAALTRCAGCAGTAPGLRQKWRPGLHERRPGRRGPRGSLSRAAISASRRRPGSNERAVDDTRPRMLLALMNHRAAGAKGRRA
jgi:hypothetical protein